MRPAWMFALGSIAFGCLLSLALMVWHHFEVRPLRHGFEVATPLMASPGIHDAVVFEGVVANVANGEQLAPLPGGLAMGFEERYVRRKQSSDWRIESSYRPRFRVLTPFGATTVEWTTRAGLPFADFPGATRVHPLSERVRAVGLAPGDKIACAARVTRTNPLLLSASDWGCFGGSLAEFRRYAVEMEPSLEDFAVVLSVFVAYAAAAALVGACLMLRDRWRARRQARANAPHTSSGLE